MRPKGKALLSLFEEGGRINHPPSWREKEGLLTGVLSLLSFGGDEARVLFLGRPPRIGEALLPWDGGRDILLQVLFAELSEEGLGSMGF